MELLEHLKRIPDDDWFLFFRFLRMPEEQIKKYQTSCLSDETKYQALKKSFETDKPSFIRKFAKYLPRTLRAQNYGRAFNDRVLTGNLLPDEIDSEDYYEMIARIGKNWLKFARTELKSKDKDIVCYGDFVLTTELKIQMSFAWIKEEGRSRNVFVEKIYQFLRENDAVDGGALLSNLR